MTRPFYIMAAAVLLLIEIGIATYAHDGFIRPHVGDSLAVLLVVFTIRAFTRFSVGASIVSALAIACGVEFGQLFGLLGFLGLEYNLLARTVLGAGFDLWDFLAYAMGGGIAVIVEQILRHRSQRRGLRSLM